MAPYLEEEALRCRMSRAVRGFQTLDEFISRLFEAGYSEDQIVAHGRDVWGRERTRQKIMNLHGQQEQQNEQPDLRSVS